MMKFSILRWCDMAWLQLPSDLTSYTASFALWASATPASFLVSNMLSHLGAFEHTVSSAWKIIPHFITFLPNGRIKAGFLSVLNSLALFLQAVRITWCKWAAKHAHFSLLTLSTWSHSLRPKGMENISTPNNASTFLCLHSRWENKDHRCSQPWCHQRWAVYLWRGKWQVP